MDLDGSPTFILPSAQDTKIPFQELVEDLNKYNLIPLLRRAEKVPQRYQIYPDYTTQEKEESELVMKIFSSPEPKKTRSPIINILLLIVTIITISYTGYLQVQGYNYFGTMINAVVGPQWAWYGDPGLLIIAFTASLLAIIGLHEMGHYLTARIRRQKASLPFFIPGYPPLGTLGAVIVQRTPTVNRDRLFELGLMGPLTGFVITIIVLIISMYLTPIIYPNVLFEIYKTNLQFNQQIISTYGYDFFGILVNLGLPYLWVGPSPFTDPLLYGFLEPLIRTRPPFTFMPVHPLSWAAWLGMLVTAINLFPIGFLDGGHMARSFLNRKYHLIASIIAAGAMLLVSTGYLLFVILIFFLSMRGGGHPGALDDVSSISKWKIAVFAIMMIVAVLTIPGIPGLF
ncbi:MAG: site-2 protease family protein [Candidatus Jordarchaeum sp.]|uniref:site-2 protease family protein n=1 Tax=Candidatus Jordarchaeum sp. TaxID=2823881 RepID=UPI004049CE8B